MRGARAGLTVSVALLAVLAVLPGCGSRGGRRAGGVQHARSIARDSSFAAVSMPRGRPPAELAAAQGRLVYGHYCAICHGDAGEGDGFNAFNVKAAFGVGPTAFTDSAAFSAVRGETILAAIRDGGGAVGKSPAMPPWGHTLTPGEIVDVAEYVRALSHPARQP